MKRKHYVANYIINPRHQLTVSLIGVGGTGSQVLTSLGRMNYALQQLGHPGLHVVAYDADIVTPANCGRQLFAEQEVGLNKAEVLVTKLNMFFGTQWESRSEMFGGGSPTSNIIISCVDTASARLIIADRLTSNYTYSDTGRAYYWLDFGNTADTGQVVLGSIGKIEQPKKKRGCVPHLKTVAEMFDLKSINDRNTGPSCSLAEALTKQDLFINSTLAQIGMAVMWKMFKYGVLDTQGAFLNLDTMKVNPVILQ